MINCIQIQWTCSSIEEGRKIARALLEKKLVACVNLIPYVESLYSWEGKIETSQEVKVLLKTQPAHFEKVKNYIEMHASYKVPAILAFLIDEGNSAYLDWLKQMTTPEKSTENS